MRLRVSLIADRLLVVSGVPVILSTGKFSFFSSLAAAPIKFSATSSNSCVSRTARSCRDSRRTFFASFASFNIIPLFTVAVSSLRGFLGGSTGVVAASAVIVGPNVDAVVASAKDSGLGFPLVGMMVGAPADAGRSIFAADGFSGSSSRNVSPVASQRAFAFS